MNFSLSPTQMAILRCQDSAILATSGRGGGKTFIGTLWALLQMLQHPGVTGLIGANVPKQLNNVVLRQLFKHLDSTVVPYCYGSKPDWPMAEEASWTGILSLQNGSKAYCRSMHESGMDNNLRGLEVGFLYIDEARDLSEAAFDVAIACLRGQKDASYRTLCTTTPSGYNWLHDRFVSDGTKRLPNSTHIPGKTSDNKKHLPVGFEQRLRSSYSKAMALQELDGLFQEMTLGRVFSFSRTAHCSGALVKAWENLPLILSADQNVAHGAALVLQIDEKTRRCQVLDEVIIGDNATTQAVAREFARRYPKASEVWFWCDPSSIRRDTRGGRTDFQIMEAELRQNLPEAKIRDACDRRRRPVADGINAINSLLDPATGKPRLQVHHDCHELIADLERLSYLEGTKQVDKSDPNRSHMSDALRYPVVELLPVWEGESGGYGEA